MKIFGINHAGARINKYCWIAALMMLCGSLPVSAAVVFPGQAPGKPTAREAKTEIALSNDVLQVTWKLVGGGIRPGQLTDKIGGQSVDLGGSLFQIVFEGGQVIDAAKLKLAGLPRLEKADAELDSARAGDHFTGQRFQATLTDPATGLEVTWRAVLRQGSNYVRQEFDLVPKTGDLAIKDITLLELQLPGGRLSGPATGAPLVSKTLFAGIEDPMFIGTVSGGRASASLKVGVPIRKGQHYLRGTVLGVAPEGQLRRAFLCYTERERAHPYRPFLHYNSWWDLGANKIRKYTEADCLGRIETYNRELVQKRGVVLSSFLFDDGWDNVDTIWEFHDGFPHGFTPLREATQKNGTGLGIWLSPFGGYTWKHTRRIAAGKAGGYEINQAGFALSGDKYYKRFRDVTVKMVRDDGVNMFKFDGLSRNTVAPPGSPFSSDFQAAIQLLKELRDVRHDIFINLTTGTWPSPFWTLLADSIWRGSGDSGFAGVGSKRQQWITYRDAITYKNIVKGCELYPLTSLMLHGIIVGGPVRELLPGDLKAEARSYFGGGTQLQELYCKPELLKDGDWDTLAESAKWSRKNAGVLVDSHWIGGDPGTLEAYGWAAWTPEGATLTLRNPSDKAQEITVDAQGAFELPKDAPTKYAMKSPYADQRVQEIKLNGAKRQTVKLEPFDVLVFEGKSSK